MRVVAELRLNQRDGVAILVGELTFHTVPELLTQEQMLMAGAGELLTIDLAGVVRGDSAGLALLIAWLRTAKQHHKRVRFLNVPSQLHEMAKVSGLEGVLSLS